MPKSLAEDGSDPAASVVKAVETQLSLLHTISCERVVLEGFLLGALRK